MAPSAFPRQSMKALIHARRDAFGVAPAQERFDGLLLCGCIEGPGRIVCSAGSALWTQEALQGLWQFALLFQPGGKPRRETGPANGLAACVTEFADGVRRAEAD